MSRPDGHLVRIPLLEVKRRKSSGRRTPLYLVRLHYDQPKPGPRDSGLGLIVLLPPLYNCSPESPKKSLSPRISLLRFSSLRVHCLIEVTWLPHVQFALMSRDKSASKQKIHKTKLPNLCCLLFFCPRFVSSNIPPYSRNKRRILCLLLGWIVHLVAYANRIETVTEQKRERPSKPIRIGRMCRE